ncbi:hypothetical protein [Vibrio coralliilyticus]|uniref:hypothetical protein n=1 Tax=Vibrio coralliilyticus TaxID=190893 RepID=UPI000BAC1687|nr:hypothetical protein [Vibrio coralliilyticus]PAW02211.1 hypothetical protein CKJ79_16245 [Vibrio coralliilyticus]
MKKTIRKNSNKQTLVKKLCHPNLHTAEYINNHIPLRLGAIVYTPYEVEGYQDVPTVSEDTGWVITGWYAENDGDIHVRCIPLHEGPEKEEAYISPKSFYGEVDLSLLAQEQQGWINDNVECYMGQMVRLNASSPHYDQYKDSEFAVLTLEGTEINEFRDSSKGKCDWRWGDDPNDVWVIIGLNANDPLTEKVAKEIDFPGGVVDGFNVLSTISCYTTLLAVKLSEISAIKADPNFKKEVEQAQDRMLTVVFSLFPKGTGLENPNNININMKALPGLVKEQFVEFFGKNIQSSSLQDFTMTLMFDEVQDVRELLAEAIATNAEVTETPIDYQSYELVFPSRHYLAIDINYLDEDAAKRIVSSIEDESDGMATGGFHRLDANGISHWGKKLKADLKDVNWFFEISAFGLEELKSKLTQH